MNICRAALAAYSERTRPFRGVCVCVCGSRRFINERKGAVVPKNVSPRAPRSKDAVAGGLQDAPVPITQASGLARGAGAAFATLTPAQLIFLRAFWDKPAPKPDPGPHNPGKHTHTHAPPPPRLNPRVVPQRPGRLIAPMAEPP